MTVKITKPEINVREELADLRKPSGVAGEAMLRAETPQEQFNLIGAGRRNWLINGSFQVSQRGVFTTASTYTSSTYYVDRWKGGVSGSLTKQHKLNQTLPNGQITNSFRVTATGGAYASIQQYVEDYSVFSGQLVTFSFWAKTNKVGCSASLYTIATQFDVVSGIVADEQWHYYKGTALVPTGGTAMRPEVWTGTGSSSGDYLELAQVQLELGNVATPFEHRSYGEELALCQRYYERFISNDNNRPLANYWAAGHANLWIPFKVEKRAAPTVSATTGSIYNGSWVNMTAIQATPTGSTGDSDGVSFMVQSSGGSAGYAAFVRDFTATFNAEL
jgi:hypothetical protein